MRASDGSSFFLRVNYLPGLSCLATSLLCASFCGTVMDFFLSCEELELVTTGEVWRGSG
jgi:hypothetical protein